MRFYEYEGALYPSVTTILSVVAKPELQRWAIRTALRELINSIGSGPVSRQELLVLAARAAAAPERIRDEAAQRGKKHHQEFVRWGKRWLEQLGLKLLEVELPVVSRRHGYAGTCDLVARGIRGLVIVDWKTGNVWPEHALQVAAYAEAVEELTQERVTRCLIVGLRDETVWYVDRDAAWSGFQGVLALWRALHSSILRRQEDDLLNLARRVLAVKDDRGVDVERSLFLALVTDSIHTLYGRDSKRALEALAWLLFFAAPILYARDDSVEDPTTTLADVLVERVPQWLAHYCQDRQRLWDEVIRQVCGEG